MSNEFEDKEIQGHEYDGITEYDNPLPMWWLWTFYGTIIFAFIYWVHYEFGGGQTLTQELEVAMNEINQAKASAPAPQQTETEESLAKAFAAAGAVESGKAQFDAKCAACHGAELQGMIGPNLVDKFWIHGKGTRMDLVKVIRTGVADKGMPGWENVLKKDELIAVASYILSKKGSNPANAKAPQGEAAE